MSTPIRIVVENHYDPPHPFKSPHVEIPDDVARQIYLRGKCEDERFRLAAAQPAKTQPTPADEAVRALVAGMAANTGTTYTMAIGAMAAIRRGDVPGVELGTLRDQIAELGGKLTEVGNKNQSLLAKNCGLQYKLKDADTENTRIIKLWDDVRGECENVRVERDRLAAQVEGLTRERKAMREARATHRCKACSALWVQHLDGSWSLCSDTCGKCCDNMAMGDQIEAIGMRAELDQALVELAAERATLAACRKAFGIAQQDLEKSTFDIATARADADALRNKAEALNGRRVDLSKLDRIRFDVSHYSSQPTPVPGGDYVNFARVCKAIESAEMGVTSP